MKKYLLLSGIVLLALTALVTSARAVGSEPDTAPAVSAVVIDGKAAELEVPLLVINSATYVSLREFSTAMGAESITWSSGTATVTAPNLTVTATAGSMYLVANGRYLFAPDKCLVVNGSVMAPIRVLCKAFDADVAWDSETKSVLITKASGAITPGSDFYDKTDLYWMARIISAEARGESLMGKIAVGGVIMNRIKDPTFPDSVYDVIFDKRYGVQFTPAYSGAIYNTPSEECVIAAKIALDGGNTAGDSLYFSQSSMGCWAARNRPYEMTIGNHSFYA